MKILLCQTNTKFLPAAPGIPYAQLTLAAHIEDAADVRITGCSSNGRFPSNDEIIKQIVEFQPEVVGMTIEYAVATSNSVLLAKQIRQLNPGIKIIAGGHQATFISDELLNTKLFDAIFIGEGEYSLRKYVIEGDYSDVPGVRYMKNSKIQDTGRSPLVDVNSLNPPAYHLMPKGLKLLMGIESSRGCPYQCNYCETRNFFGSGLYRKMSPEIFIRNLRHILDSGSSFNFFLVDDCFTADMKGHAKEICNALIKEDLVINFMIQARVDNLIQNLDMLPMFKKAGLRTIILGIESIYQHTLNSMNKSGYTEQGIKDLLKSCQDNGLKTFVSVIFGYPNETREMILRTTDFFIENNINAVSMSLVTPLPGSDLYRQALKNNEILSQDYDLYDYTHRLWSKMPKYSVDTVNIARRRFYLRPDYIEEVLTGIIGSTEIDVPTLQVAAIFTFAVRNPLVASPRTAEEFLRLLEGLRRVLAKKMKSTPKEYNQVIRFQVESISLYFTVENGLLTKIDDKSDSHHDFSVLLDIPTFVDLILGYQFDIVSALVLGKVKISEQVKMLEISNFISWFWEIQKLLQWEVDILRSIKILPERINEWINEDNKRTTHFKETFLNESILFLHTGSKEEGGVKFYFEKPNKLLDILFVKKKPEKINFEVIIDRQEMKKIFQGDISTLFNILISQDIKVISQKTLELIEEPKQFFEKLIDNFNPEAAEYINLKIQYIIKKENEEKELWWLKINEKKLDIYREELDGKPDASILISKKSFLELINGRKHPLELITGKEMKIEGNPMLVMRMDKCFKESLVKFY
jgi:anaerobic magnesium-protoporphyrin IX monomethyl ester cyclase